MLSYFLEKLRMVSAFSILSLIVTVSAQAQSCPAQGTQIFPELSGQALIDALVDEYGTTDNIGYDNARDIMYSQIDSDNGQLTGIYTGYTITLDPNDDPSSDAFSKGINAEHAWPQNKGASSEPARSDMHHLYPAYANANSSRGREPFIEIPDSETESWWRNDESTSTPDANFVDEYSERKDGHPSGLLHPGSTTDFYDSWEPREDAKGDIARSMFYFYTMYKNLADQADPNFFEVQKSYLRTWNNSESVSDKEYQRTCAIAEISGNTVNPFVIDPTLVDRAYFEGQISQTNVGFAATVLNITEGQSELEIEVSITNPNPDTATTVDVTYAGGTATAGEDFQSFSTQTLTFPAGSFEQQTFSITFLDNEIEEVDETISLALENISGPEQAGIAQAADTATITIRDNDGVAPTIVWINEFHYDNDGGDTGEFVELAVNAQFADLSDVTLTLYNGNGGSSYGSYSGTDFVAGGSQNGISFYYVDLPTNGLQNGSPDGMSLDIEGELVQFLSYEGTFSAADGPAEGIESTDIGVEQPGNSPVGSSVSLAGTGRGYADFSWEFTESNTMGNVNSNQMIEEDDSEPQPSEPTIVQFTNATISLYENEETATVGLEIFNPNSDTATTVQVSRVGGTATDDDFDTFETNTLTFAAGSDQEQSFNITLTDDELYEKNETIVLAIESIDGSATSEIGQPDSLTITIVNDDDNDRNSRLSWINEIHYQNAGPDSAEFVEIVTVGIPVKQRSNFMDGYTLTLYNGATGEAYASFTADDIQEAEEFVDDGGGFALFAYADISGIQNGNPDGVSLTYQNEFVQFLSYGGSFAAVDGPAKDHQSEDIGIVEPEEANSSVSLALSGAGYRYSDYEWAVSDSSTKGSINANQGFDIPSSAEEEGEVASNYRLHQNYPNPFNPSTVISYQLAENSTISLQVFDMLGREVASIANNERKAAGSYQVTFDAGNLSSGMYIYRLSTSSGVQLTKKMLLMK